MSEKPRRIVFRDENNEVRWFSENECQLRWTGYSSGEFGPVPNEELALLPGDKWVIYGQPSILGGERLSKVRFVSAKEAMDWLLVGGHEPPECLTNVFAEKSVTKSTDKRNENLLQVQDEDDGDRPVVIDITGAEHWGPCNETGGDYNWDHIPEWFYEDDLYRLASGRFVRIRHPSHREVDLPVPPSVKRLSEEEAAKWLLFNGFEPPHDIASFAMQHRFRDDVDRTNGTSDGAVLTPQPLEPSEDVRKSYRDPDNYWRNVWLYEQRRAGKANAVILAELAERAAEFAPIDSENALRAAIESIALYHQWPILKGKAGRPQSRRSDASAR